MAKAIEIVSSGDVQKQFGRYSDEAMIRPVGVTKNGHLRFVMLPIDEYQRLRRRERVAGGVEDLSEDMIEAIRTAEPGAKSHDAEARLGTA
jgi:PHD/YefM family antitoxin component YafN of YafNO toxin-antitoxin module